MLHAAPIRAITLGSSAWLWTLTTTLLRLLMGFAAGRGVDLALLHAGSDTLFCSIIVDDSRPDRSSGVVVQV